MTTSSETDAQARIRRPTEAETHAYAECLRFDRLRFEQRRLGRAGYLSADDEARHSDHYRTIESALNGGAVFDQLGAA